MAARVGWSDWLGLHYWLQNYAPGADDPRRFEVTGKMGGEAVEYEAAGAVLLGLEVGRLASSEAGQVVDRFLRESGDPYTPFVDGVVARALDGERDAQNRAEAFGLLKALERGYRRLGA